MAFTTALFTVEPSITCRAAANLSAIVCPLLLIFSLKRVYTQGLMGGSNSANLEWFFNAFSRKPEVVSIWLLQLFYYTEKLNNLIQIEIISYHSRKKYGIFSTSKLFQSKIDISSRKVNKTSKNQVSHSPSALVDKPPLFVAPDASFSLLQNHSSQLDFFGRSEYFPLFIFQL